MPTPQEEFQNAVLRILETVMFENWIRFYFLTEKLDAPVEEGAEKPLFVAIPEPVSYTHLTLPTILRV